MFWAGAFPLCLDCAAPIRDLFITGDFTVSVNCVKHCRMRGRTGKLVRRHVTATHMENRAPGKQWLEIVVVSGWDPFFDFRRPKIRYAPPPPLDPFVYPSLGNVPTRPANAVFTHTPSAPPKWSPPIRFYPPPLSRKCILDSCRNIAKTVTEPALPGKRQLSETSLEIAFAEPLWLNVWRNPHSGPSKIADAIATLSGSGMHILSRNPTCKYAAYHA